MKLFSLTSLTLLNKISESSMIKLHSMKDDIKSTNQYRNTVLSIETDYKDKPEGIKNVERILSNDPSLTKD